MIALGAVDAAHSALHVDVLLSVTARHTSRIDRPRARLFGGSSLDEHVVGGQPPATALVTTPHHT